MNLMRSYGHTGRLQLARNCLRELDEKRDAGVGSDGEAATEGLDALAHAAKTVALVQLRVSAIIGDEKRVVTVAGGRETHAAVCGLRVGHDVLYRFANGEAEHGP